MQPGIKKDSENYQKAVKLLLDAKVPVTILKEHKLDNNYVRLDIVEEAQIDKLYLQQTMQQGITLKINLSDDQRKALHQVYGLYEKEQLTKERFERLLEEETRRYPHLKEMKEWWDRIDTVFELTTTGAILGNANANKSDAQVPMIYD